MNSLHARIAGIPPLLDETQNYGIAFDALCHNPVHKTVSMPRSHQVVRITQDQESEGATVHYSVRQHRLAEPDDDLLDNLKDILAHGRFTRESDVTQANFMAYQIMRQLNPHSRDGFKLGEWDSATTHYMTLDKDLAITAVTCKPTSVMMVEFVTPQEAESRIASDPNKENLGLWVQAMARHEQKPALNMDMCTTATTNLINKQMQIQAMERNIPAIFRYKTGDLNVKGNHFYCYSDDFGAVHPAYGAVMESALMPSTKCDDIAGCLNIASLAAFGQNKQGIFEDLPYGGPDKTADFMRTMADFLNVAYDRKLMDSIRSRYRR